MTQITAEELIAFYSLSPHPEGGWFAETYRAAGMIPQEALPGFSGARAYSTCIFYLLTFGEKSRLHRIKQDETWHFYLGGPLRLAHISPEGKAAEVLMGQSPARGQRLQYTVPAGHWFGAAPLEEGTFCFCGCTVAPGFEFADFELGDKNELMLMFPHLARLVDEF